MARGNNMNLDRNMFEKVKLVCLSNEEGKKDWLAKGFDEVIFSADQLRSNLLIGEALPEKIVFDGRLQDFIHLFPMRSIDESCAPMRMMNHPIFIHTMNKGTAANKIR